MSGFINANGKVMIPLTEGDASPCSEGYCGIQVGDAKSIRLFNHAGSEVPLPKDIYVNNPTVTSGVFVASKITGSVARSGWMKPDGRFAENTPGLFAVNATPGANATEVFKGLQKSFFRMDNFRQDGWGR